MVVNVPIAVADVIAVPVVVQNDAVPMTRVLPQAARRPANRLVSQLANRLVSPHVPADAVQRPLVAFPAAAAVVVAEM